MKLMKIAAATAVMALGAGAASAATMLSQVDEYFRGTECGANGVFAVDVGEPGQGFSNCAIYIEDDIISPVIVKFGGDLTLSEVSSKYPSISGSEFSFSNTVDKDAADKNISGTWSYTPGVDDPAVRFWAAKAGNGFNLFWTVASTDLESGGACFGGLFVSDCLNAAVEVSTGTWFTPDEKGLSHLTFFNGGSTVIPLPAAGWLLIAGLGGLAAVKRRKRAA